MSVPRKLTLDVGGPTMPVRQRRLGGKLGHVDTGEWEIAVEQKQPEAGKHLILLHELIHLCAESLKAEGHIKRQPDEAFVEHLAGRLFPILALSGIWQGVSKSAVRRFLKSIQEDR